MIVSFSGKRILEYRDSGKAGWCPTAKSFPSTIPNSAN